MRVVLLGATRFSAACLDALRRTGAEIAGVVTTAPDIRISYAPSGVNIAQHVDLRDAAAAAGCPVLTVSGPPREYRDAIASMRPDFILAAGWYYLVPASIRGLAAKGAAGLHGSLLPRYRGGAPVSWAIINGEQCTGVTFFYLEDAVDAGDIIGQETVPITFDDTCATVYERITAGACRLIETYVPLIARGAAPRQPQNEAEATVFPQRAPADGVIDWTWPARRIYDWVRAQTRPYPGAFSGLEGRQIRIWRTRPLSDPSAAPPGEIVAVDAAGADVATGDGTIRLLDVEGCDIAAFERGMRFAPPS